MIQRRRRAVVLAGTVALGMLLALVIPFVAQGADQYASAAFQQQWNTVEAVIPNFWGPLATARTGQTEQYAEGVLNGQPGVRLVQYFDKARMEQTSSDRPVTNGLLTVELKSGQLQLGDNSFQPLNPAFIGIAGDPNVPGPTYASLAQLPEKSPQQNGGVNLGYDQPSQTFVSTPASTDPAMQFATYQSDPGGRFGQSIPAAFWNFLQAIPGGWLTTMGYPISPAFAATVQVNGTPKVVIAQAFQRRVLTYTATNPAGFRVEFGNIGQHYYAWRYQQSTTTVGTATPTTGATATTAPDASATTAAATTHGSPPSRGIPPTVAAPVGATSPTPGSLPGPRP